MTPSHIDSATAMPLIFAIDRAFLEPLQNALRSLAKVYTQPDPLEVHVVHAEPFNDKEIETLRSAVASRPAIHFEDHQVDTFTPDTTAEINHGAYVRLAIPTLFAEYEQVIYLDADIVFVKSPYEFARFQLHKDAIIAASQDVQNPTLGSGIALPGWSKLGLSGDQSYFNSGVMVIHPQRWNQAAITQQTVDFVQAHPEHLRFRDQDALNYLLRSSWQPLPLKWNYPPLSAILKVPGAQYYAEAVFPLQQILDGEQSAVLFHFVGPDKPWKEGFPEGEIMEIYRKNTQ